MKINLDEIFSTSGSLVSHLIGAYDHRQRHVHQPANPVANPVRLGCNRTPVPEYYADLYEHDEDDELLDDGAPLYTDGYHADREFV